MSTQEQILNDLNRVKNKIRELRQELRKYHSYVVMNDIQSVMDDIQNEIQKLENDPCYLDPYDVPVSEIGRINEIQECSYWYEKVVWAINKYGTASTDEIANAIAMFDGSDFNEVKPIVVGTATNLFKKNLIN
ncbi:hypothetical protein EBU94_06215, partial [bacterium]|nr:hypothetical protein [bacterium]